MDTEIRTKGHRVLSFVAPVLIAEQVRESGRYQHMWYSNYSNEWFLVINESDSIDEVAKWILALDQSSAIS